MDMILMCGIPRSGKSSLALEKYQRHGYVRICPDDIRIALTGRDYWPAAEPIIWAMAETMVRALLISGHDVVIDATNITRNRRNQWTRLAREFGVSPTIVVFRTPLDICLKRNKDANRVVPEEVIRRMNKQFEMPVEAEGEIIDLGWDPGWGLGGIRNDVPSAP